MTLPGHDALAEEWGCLLCHPRQKVQTQRPVSDTFPIQRGADVLGEMAPGPGLAWWDCGAWRPLEGSCVGSCVSPT